MYSNIKFHFSIISESMLILISGCFDGSVYTDQVTVLF